MNLTTITDRTHEALDSLGEITHIEGEPTAEKLVYALGLVDDLAKLTRDLKGLIETDLINTAEHDEVVSGNLRAVIKPRPAKKRTDWPLLLPAAVRAIDDMRIVNEETGEVESTIDAVLRVLPDLVPLTASVSPKTTGLKLLGIDRDAYTNTEWAGPSVKLERLVDAVDGGDVSAEAENKGVAA